MPSANEPLGLVVSQIRSKQIKPNSGVQGKDRQQPWSPFQLTSDDIEVRRETGLMQHELRDIQSWPSRSPCNAAIEATKPTPV